MARQHNHQPQSQQVFADNCEACGAEHLNTELNSVVLRGINGSLRLCKKCIGKDTLADYCDVIDLIKNG